MVAALGMAGLSTAYSLFKMLQARSSGASSGSTAGTQDASATGQNLPTGTTGPASFDPAALFSALDADKSGGISKDELSTGLKTARNSSSAAASAIDPRTFGALLSVQEASQQSNRASKLFDKLDADKSGAISMDELTAGLAGSKQVDASKNGLDALFAMIDKDKDGKISADELKSAMENAAQNRHGRHHRHEWSGLTASTPTTTTSTTTSATAGTTATADTTQSAAA